MGSLLTGANWPALTQKDLSIIFKDQHRAIPSMGPYIVRFKDAEQGTEYDLETGDVGKVPAFTGDISYDSPQQGYKKAISETEYCLGIKVTRRLLRNDLYSVIQDRTRMLAIAFKDLYETLYAYPFVHAFDGAFTTGDTLSLCNSAHTSNYLGSNQSNTSTVAFSAANVQANRILMKKFKTNRDNIMTNIPDTLIVPLDLEDKAYEIIQSAGKVDTANNNRNYSEGRYKLIVWDNYITSTTNWFLTNQMWMKQALVFREWEPTQFFRSGEFDSLVSKHAAYASCAISTVEWRWIMGSSN